MDEIIEFNNYSFSPDLKTNINLNDFNEQILSSLNLNKQQSDTNSIIKFNNKNNVFTMLKRVLKVLFLVVILFVSLIILFKLYSSNDFFLTDRNINVNFDDRNINELNYSNKINRILSEEEITRNFNIPEAENLNLTEQKNLAAALIKYKYEGKWTSQSEIFPNSTVKEGNIDFRFSKLIIEQDYYSNNNNNNNNINSQKYSILIQLLSGNFTSNWIRITTQVYHLSDIKIQNNTVSLNHAIAFDYLKELDEIDDLRRKFKFFFILF